MKMSPALFDCGAFLAGGIFLLLSGCALRSAPDEAPAQKPPQSRQLVSRSIATLPATQAVTTAHPLATQVALRILDQGGAPIDAAIAAQMVLGLVEPQSSGVGGGSLIMQWDSAARKLTSYDGLAAAPAKVTAGLTIDVDGSVMKSEAVQRGGRSVGVPGTLAVLKQVHDYAGKLAWSALFAPAIELAESGFPMPAYLHSLLSAPTAAGDHPDMVPLYFGADGKVRAVGTTVTNAAYATTMRRIATRGPAGLWADDAGAALVATAQRGIRPSLIAATDLVAYRAKPYASR